MYGMVKLPETAATYRGRPVLWVVEFWTHAFRGLMAEAVIEFGTPGRPSDIRRGAVPVAAIEVSPR